MLTLAISYRGMVALGLAALTVLALIRLWPIVLLMTIALMLMGALLPAVEALERRGVRRGFCVAIVFLAVLVGIVALFGVTAPVIVGQFQSVIDDAPGQAARLDAWLQGRGIEARLSERLEQIDWERIALGSANYGRAALGAVFSAFTVFVLTIYFV